MITLIVTHPKKVLLTIFSLTLFFFYYAFIFCFNNINDILDSDGIVYGSTPFLFHIHQSPNDYFRFTKQFLEEFLKEKGYKDIEVKILGTGIFCNMYSSLFNLTKIIPFLNVIIFSLAIIFDKVLNIFLKNIKDINPLGYFFIAKKN